MDGDYTGYGVAAGIILIFVAVIWSALAPTMILTQGITVAPIAVLLAAVGGMLIGWSSGQEM